MTDYLRYRRIRIFDCAKWAAPNNRYLEFVAAIDDPSASLKELDRLSHAARDKNRGFRGFNFFPGDDLALLRAVLDGGFCVSNRQKFVELNSSRFHSVRH